jgi:hypothetical protein
MKGRSVEFSTAVIALLAASLAVLPYIPPLQQYESMPTHVILTNPSPARYPFQGWYTLNTDEVANGSSLSGVVTFHYRKDYYASGTSFPAQFYILTETAYDFADLESFRRLSLFTSSDMIRSYDNFTYFGYAARFNLTCSKTDKYYFLLVTWGTDKVTADLLITQTKPATWIVEVGKYNAFLTLVAAVFGILSYGFHRRRKRRRL